MSNTTSFSSRKAILQGSKDATSADPEKISDSYNEENVEKSDAEDDANVPPVMAIIDIERRKEELVGCGCRAILTVARRIRVGQVATRSRDVIVQVRSARESTRRGESDQLLLRAYDWVATNGLTDQSFYEVRLWRDSVHPLPPAKLAERLQHTIESDDERVNGTEEHRSNHSIR